MYNSAIAVTLSSLVATALTPAAMAQGDPPAITEAGGARHRRRSYVYFYSLVTMDVTRKQFTNFEPGKCQVAADEHVQRRTNVSAGG